MYDIIYTLIYSYAILHFSTQPICEDKAQIYSYNYSIIRLATTYTYNDTILVGCRYTSIGTDVDKVKRVCVCSV